MARKVTAYSIWKRLLLLLYTYKLFYIHPSTHNPTESDDFCLKGVPKKTRQKHLLRERRAAPCLPLQPITSHVDAI